MEHSVTSKKTTDYFRRAVAVQGMKAIPFKDGNFWTTNQEDFESGLIQEEIAQEVFKHVSKKENFEKKPKKTIPILICARTLKTSFSETMNSERTVECLTGVFFLPAELNREGELELPEEGKEPWTPREYLFPMAEPQISLGSIEEYDSFLSNSLAERHQIETWTQYLDYSKRMFQRITAGSSNQGTEPQVNIEYDENVYIMLDDTVSATHHILDIYQELLDTTQESKLYEQFMRPAIEQPLLCVPNNSPSKMAQHIGQMNGSYPLSASQREVVDHFSEISEGEILAVNGPPGTGKTTLLQSIVANMVVEHALRKDAPPIIFATSTNNQAVTNIIDSFGQTNKVLQGNLEERWVDGVDSFALYFPSTAKEKIDKALEAGYQVSSVRGGWFADTVDSEDNVNASKKRFSEGYSEFFQKNFVSLESSEISIQKRLQKLNNILETVKDSFIAIGVQTGKCSVREFIQNCSAEIVKLEEAKTEKREDLASVNVEIQLAESGLEKWQKVKDGTSSATKIFSFLPTFSQKIEAICTLNKTPEETVRFQNLNSFNSLISQYVEQITSEKTHQYEISTKIGEIEQETALLKKKVDIVQALRTQCLHAIKEGLQAEGSASFKNLLDDEQFCVKSVNEVLDTTIRYQMFWLAVHYYECRWLQQRKGEILTEKQKGTNHEGVLNVFYHRLAMLTPCMVNTCFMMPKQFLAYDGNAKKNFYMHNFADLLIVDEAGQVSPEIAAPVFSLAKKAIVVGDIYQIPPVWGTSEALDHALAKEAKVVSSKDDFEKLLNVGLNCHSSSVMTVASNSCKYDKYEKGLFLCEHRRCYDEIIDYSNRLVYHNRLEPLRGKRGQKEKYPLENLSTMGHFNIAAERSLKEGTSRYNKKEAVEIVKWIERNYQKIKEQYKGIANEEQLIGIVTPFKAQAQILGRELRKAMPDIAKIITVGTVHTFQGAEKRVVIFSSTYGSEDGCYFINNNKPLMNVAVSRAKDAFLVFGERKCLGIDTETVSGLLRELTSEEVRSTI
jgi:energy-coupling factor transporter ATP-binding protein EcfA2